MVAESYLNLLDFYILFHFNTPAYSLLVLKSSSNLETTV